MHRTKLRGQLRKLRAALEAKDKPTAQALLRPTLAMLDHMVHKGILQSNAAARHKSRLTRGVTALSAS